MIDSVSKKEGAPWTQVAKYETFEGADQKRLELLVEENLQVKIHRCGPGGEEFAVKTRRDPSMEELRLKKEEKARRKKRLSKKRRKK